MERGTSGGGGVVVVGDGEEREIAYRESVITRVKRESFRSAMERFV